MEAILAQVREAGPRPGMVVPNTVIILCRVRPAESVTHVHILGVNVYFMYSLVFTSFFYPISTMKQSIVAFKTTTPVDLSFHNTFSTATVAGSTWSSHHTFVMFEVQSIKPSSSTTKKLLLANNTVQ